MKKLTWLLLLVLHLTVSWAQEQLPPRSLDSALKSITLAYAEGKYSGAPGMIVSIVKPNVWQWSFAYGHADVAKNLPATTDMVFRAGSVSKLFCAAAVVKLLADGKINLTDPIDHWLPASHIPKIDGQEKICLKDLLRHTSGFSDVQFETLGEDVRATNPLRDYTDTIFDMIAGLQGHSPPGSFRYSNTNYALLTQVVAKAAGLSYREYVSQKILLPLGLQHTYFDSLPKTPVLRGYRSSVGLARYVDQEPFLFDNTDANMSFCPGGGEICATLADLTSFYMALNEGKLFPASYVRSMTSDFVFTTSQFYSGYGYGTMLLSNGGKTYATGHAGNSPGYTTLLLRFDNGVYVCLALNRMGISHRLMLREYILKLYPILANQ